MPVSASHPNNIITANNIGRSNARFDISEEGGIIMGSVFGGICVLACICGIIRALCCNKNKKPIRQNPIRENRPEVEQIDITERYRKPKIGSAEYIEKRKEERIIYTSRWKKIPIEEARYLYLEHLYPIDKLPQFPNGITPYNPDDPDNDDIIIESNNATNAGNSGSGNDGNSGGVDSRNTNTLYTIIEIPETRISHV
jgi:hypothetical protein